MELRLPDPLPTALDRRGREIGALLVAAGALTHDQLDEALLDQAASGRRLGEVVVERGWSTRRSVAEALAEQAGLEFLDLRKATLDPSATGLLPEKFARRYSALPVLFLDDTTVLVAVADPTDIVSADDLRLAIGLDVKLAVVEREDLEETIGHAYRGQVEIVETTNDDEPEEPAEPPIEDVRAGGSTTAPAIRLVNQVLAAAIEEGASDIHFEPQDRELVVRARVDGVTRRVTSIPKGMQAAVISRLKIMGELDIAERRAPQDGRITIRYGKQGMDLRIAVLPTTYGEQVVLRILHRAEGRIGLDSLGMSPAAAETFMRAIHQPYGAVIAVGPTGSGKTTTLYAGLDLLNEEGRVLQTIEDPVEWQIPGVNQVEVNTRAGLTFSQGLRTLLRSDPDVVLVGEMRDEETARIAIQAAMTGHLVLTSLHTHNAAASIARLKDMGVEPSLVATAINCIVAQRLARRLCVDCREAYEPEAAERAEFGLAPGGTLFRAVGCGRCGNTGYRGRVALYEVMPIHGRIRKLIEASTEEIFAAAVEEGMTTLRSDGIRLCLAGTSSVDEIRRVTGDRLV
ncbi:MAG TPA: GspE/PulE family protein [Gaiellaceae bacterium]|nr:GspE/PulE family protein [Gaiellaceae bacterium]